jgi:hypothetical protein
VPSVRSRHDKTRRVPVLSELGVAAWRRIYFANMVGGLIVTTYRQGIDLSP